MNAIAPNVADRASARIEQLEARTLFAESTVIFSNGWLIFTTPTGTLYFQGSERAETLSLEAGSRFLVADVGEGSRPLEFDLKSFKRIFIDANAGNDRVNTRGRHLIKLTTVAGGGGDDVLLGKFGQTLSGGAGDDLIDASAPTPPAFADVTERVRYVYDILDANGTAVKLAVYHTIDFATTQLFGGAGDDTITGIGGADTVSGGPGHDTLNLPGEVDITDPIPNGLVDSVERFVGPSVIIERVHDGVTRVSFIDS